MKRFVIGLILVTGCFGQGKKNVVQTGVVDAHGATWVPPSTRFSAPPSTPPTGAVYVFTDAAATGSCTGGGSALATCRWSGSDWQAVGGGGGATSQPSIFTGGTLVQRQVECASGTVPFSALTAATPAQEITIQTGIAGNVRWDQVLISETTQFAGIPTLSVSMGRPGVNNNLEMSGVSLPLKLSGGDANYWSTRPIPPQLAGTYSIVLNFLGNGNLGNGSASNFTAGAVSWEVCGYAAR